MNDKEKLRILLEWKKQYIEALIDALKPTGTVLEVGFGIGVAANRIQSFQPKSHVIIEANPEVASEAKQWSASHPSSQVIEGNWESALKKLGAFDAIFYNDYPLEHDTSILNYLFPEEILQSAGEAKQLLKLFQAEFTHLKQHFSDEEIEKFYRNVGQHKSEELPKFFQTLKDNGNISQAQYESLMNKYHLKEGKQSAPIKREAAKPDEMLAFLEECLKSHMKKGSRFTCFLNRQTSKYEDAQFFESIITNPAIDFKETKIPLKPSDKSREGTVILVEKTA